MSEPEYTYARGKGWVLALNTVQTFDGKQATLEFRVPESGELAAHSGGEEFSAEWWADWISSVSSGELLGFYKINFKPYDDFNWVVFKLLDE